MREWYWSCRIQDIIMSLFMKALNWNCREIMNELTVQILKEMYQKTSSKR